MQNINIGKSGISVPFLGMGTWAIGGGAWWGDNDDALSVKAIQTAVEQGIQWIDTAPIYGLYHSEEVVGEAMKHIDRDKVVLSTKCGLEWRHESPILHKVVDGVQVYRDLSAKGIIEDVEDSLRRLAQRMANRAVKTGRKVVLEPMNPYERRVLHTALQNHPAVTTHSEGEEPNRRVVIMLKNQPERPEKSADKPQGEKPSRSRRSRRRGPRKPVNPAENQTANEPQETVAAPESPAAVDVLGVEE